MGSQYQNSGLPDFQISQAIRTQDTCLYKGGQKGEGDTFGLLATTFESFNKTSSGKNRGRERYAHRLGLLSYNLEWGTANRLHVLGLTRKHLEKEAIVLT